MMKAQDYEQFETLKELQTYLADKGVLSGALKGDELRRSTVAKIPAESVYQKAILDYLRDELPNERPGISVKAFKLQAGPYMQGGLPDVWAVIKLPEWALGVLFCFEVKRPFVGKLSDLQRQALKDLGCAGAVTATVSYVSEVRKIVNDTIDGIVEGGN